MATGSSAHLPDDMAHLADVVLVVGPQKVRLNAVRSVLVQSSAVFTTLLASRRKRALELPDDQPEIMEIILATLHEDDDHLSSSVNGWLIPELFSLAYTSRKYAVQHQIRKIMPPYIISHIHIPPVFSGHHAQALYVSCTFDLHKDIGKLLAELITRASVDMSGSWWWHVDQNMSDDGSPDSLTLLLSQNCTIENYIIKKQLLNAGECCPGMLDFIISQRRPALDAMWRFAKLFTSWLHNENCRLWIGADNNATDDFYTISLLPKLHQMELTKPETLLPERLQLITPFQLYYEMFAVDTSAWPQAIKRSTGNWEGVNGTMTEYFEIFVWELGNQIAKSCKNGWTALPEDWVTEWFERDFHLD